MKRTISTFFAVLTAFFILTAIPFSASAEPVSGNWELYYEDKFDSGVISRDWEIVDGEWAALPDALSATSGQDTLMINTKLPTDSTNFAIQVDVYIDGKGAALLGWYADANNGFNHYLTCIDTDAKLNRFYKLKPLNFIEHRSVDYLPEKWYTMRVEVTNQHEYMIWLVEKGEEINNKNFTYYVYHNTLNSGYVGLGRWNTTINFQNFQYFLLSGDPLLDNKLVADKAVDNEDVNNEDISNEEPPVEDETDDIGGDTNTLDNTEDLPPDETPETPTAPEPSDKQEDDSSTSPIILPIIIGALVLVLGSIIILVVFLTKRKNK